MLKWEAFRDLFRALVHDVIGLSDSQKLQYLKASLEGEAAVVVDNIDISTEGYASAWVDLVDRYDNPRVLLAEHMRALLASSPITRPSAPEINRLLSTMVKSLRSFKSMGRPVDGWDDWFVHLTVEKLNPATRVLWKASLKTSRDFPTFAELREFLFTRARALDAAGPRVASSTSGTSRDSRGGCQGGVTSHAASAKGTEQSKKCPVCRDRYPLCTCRQFKALTVEKRREQARQFHACFNCLSLSHRASQCPSGGRCGVCAERHHTLLHAKETANASDPIGSVRAPAAKSENTSERESAKVATLAAATSGTVLLATARVKLVTECGRTMTVRALLDSSSEASFVTERVAKLLKLLRRKVNVTVTGMQGIVAGRATHAITVSLCSPRKPALRIALPRVLVLPRLTALIPGRRVPKGDWDHLRVLELADPAFDNPAAVDLTLGAEVFGILFEGEVRRGRQGDPAAYSSALG